MHFFGTERHNTIVLTHLERLTPKLDYTQEPWNVQAPHNPCSITTSSLKLVPALTAQSSLWSEFFWCSLQSMNEVMSYEYPLNLMLM